MPPARSFAGELPRLVRMRAESMGEEGRDWIAGLDDIALELQSAWQIEIGEILSGGSESLVATVVRADGSQAILKIGLPGSSDLANEARVYELAAGNGYVQLFESNLERNAILVEKLGPLLASEHLSLDRQIASICETLNEAWVPVTGSHGFMTGAEKSKWLAEFIEARWESLHEPCDRATVYRAIEFTEVRIDAFQPESSVLVHGDAHAANTLRVPGSNRYKFIDPDGLFAEKACDLAVIMRDWNAELAADPVALLVARGEQLSELTGVDRRAIWEWGFVERVSTGMVLLEIGLKEEGTATLEIADAVRNVTV